MKPSVKYSVKTGDKSPMWGVSVSVRDSITVNTVARSVTVRIQGLVTEMATVSVTDRRAMEVDVSTRVTVRTTATVTLTVVANVWAVMPGCSAMRRAIRNASFPKCVSTPTR